MTPPSYQRELEVALEAVHQAARLTRSVQGQVAEGTLEKGDKSPVTVADFGSQALVCRALQEAFPDDPVVGEEDAAALRRDEHGQLLERVVYEVGLVAGGEPVVADEVCAWIDRGNAGGTSRRFWTLDPIDGTKGFLRGEHYSIALALIEDGQVVLGVVGSPNLPLDPSHLTPDAGGPKGVLFHAVTGRGTWVQGLDAGGEPERTHADAGRELTQARVCESVEKGHTSQTASARVAQRLGITAPPRRLDSLVKYGLVARGDAELYMRLPKGSGYVEKIWDHAAGVLLVTEAGGRVTDVDGRPIDFGHGPELRDNRGVVASSGAWHDEVLEAIRAVAQPEEAPR